MQEIIKLSVKRLYDKDNSLLKRRGLERSIAFRLALYLNEELGNRGWLNEYNFDLEYNKNGDKPKRTARRPKGVQPDMILHQREHNAGNILVVEMKGWWNEEDRDDDYIKIEDFTHQQGEYKYGLGVFLDFEKESCEPEYFINAEHQ